MSLSEDPLRELCEDVDLVLHFGPPPERGPWISSTLLATPERLVASSAYLRANGAPRRLEELSEHALLSWRPPGEDGQRWPLRDGGTLAVSPLVISPDVHMVRQLAAAGHGIALIPDGGVPESPTIPGPLEGVLPELVGRPNALRVLMPEPMARLSKGRALLAMARDLIAGFALLDPGRSSG